MSDRTATTTIPAYPVPIVKTELVAICDLKEFPHNARRRDDRAGKALADSVRRFGQFRSIAVRASTMHVIAGWHTVKEMERQGHTHARCDFLAVDAKTARRINLADNRLNDLGTYDDEALLAGLDEVAGDLGGTGYSGDDLDAVRRQIDVPLSTEPLGSSYREQYGVIVVCTDEAMQKRVYDQLVTQGLPCKVVNT